MGTSGPPINAMASSFVPEIPVAGEEIGGARGKTDGSAGSDSEDNDSKLLGNDGGTDTDESPDGSGDAMRVTFEVHDGALVPVVYNYSHPVPLNELGVEVCGVVCGLDVVGKVGCRMISPC